MSTPGPFWPHLVSSNEMGDTAVDLLGVVFFMERSVCAEPQKIVRAFETYLSIFRNSAPPLSYVDDEGDMRALPDNPRPVLEQQLVQALQSGDESVRMALVDATQPPYRYHAHCFFLVKPDDELLPDERVALFFRITQEALAELGPPAVLRFALALSEFLPYTHGYVSPVLSCDDNFRAALPYVHRHPGLDVSDLESVAVDLGDRPTGPHWINVFGPRFSQTVGGAEALRAALPPEAVVSPAGQGGVAVQLGERPDIGDVNRQNDLLLYRQLASLLRPHLRSPEVSYFTDAEGLLDPDAQAAWHQRFLR